MLTDGSISKLMTLRLVAYMLSANFQKQYRWRKLRMGRLTAGVGRAKAVVRRVKTIASLNCILTECVSLKLVFLIVG